MPGEQLIALGAQAIWLTALLLVPVLLATVVAAAAAGSLQTLTQWHDASLTFVPKVALVTLVFAFAGTWMFQHLVHYTEQLWALLTRVHV